MKSGFSIVVYVDALGTSEGQSDYQERFSDFRDEVDGLFKDDHWLNDLTIKGLSDSVFFVLHISKTSPNEKDRESHRYKLVEDFFEKLRELQNICITIKMPLRGGISLGDVTVEPLSSQIFDYIGGIPVVQAARVEKTLKMCGIAFAPIFMLQAEYHDLYKRYTAHLMKRELIAEFDIPTDFGLVESYCVTWPENIDRVELCKRFAKYQPQKMEDFKPPTKDVSKAAKYLATVRLTNTSCKKEM